MSGGHSVFDLFEVINLFENYGVDHSLKEAILLPALADSVEKVKFFEVACKNKGYNVKVFNNREEALTWLLG